jgi:outer membrane protein TolC
LFALANSQREMARILRESIIPKTEQALKIAIHEYEVGTTEFVQLMENWRELLRLQITQQQLESQLRQTIASLRRVVGGFTIAATESVPIPEPTSESTIVPMIE